MAERFYGLVQKIFIKKAGLKGYWEFQIWNQTKDSRLPR